MPAVADVTVEAWALALLGGIAAVVAAVIAVQRWLRREFVPRGEYHAPDCSARARECAALFARRDDVERELRHRADRTHELANALTAFQGQVRKMEHELTVLGVIVRSIAKNLGVDVSTE